MAQTASDQHDFSLMEFLRGFMEFSSLSGQENFPPFNHRLWHEFLYLLKSEYEEEFPQLKCIGNFDWDGAYPKCRDLHDVMFGLQSICYVIIPAGQRIALIKKISTEINTVLLYHHQIAQKALEIAQTFPGFFEK